MSKGLREPGGLGDEVTPRRSETPSRTTAAEAAAAHSVRAHIRQSMTPFSSPWTLRCWSAMGCLAHRATPSKAHPHSRISRDPVSAAVRPIAERRFDPPREVHAEHSGRWWPAAQVAWRLRDDGRGWLADVT